MDDNKTYSIIITFLIIAFLHLLVRLFTGKPVSSIYKGEDGRYSLSIFQTYLWTIVVLGSFIYIYVLGICTCQNSNDCTVGSLLSRINIPVQLYILMGIAVFTTISAKVITKSNIENNNLNKTYSQTSKFSDLISNDTGKTELSKIQELFWNIIIAAFYLIEILVMKPKFDGIGAIDLPSISSGLLALLGIGNGFYLGDKYFFTNLPKLFSLSPDKVKAGEKVTINGSNFSSDKSAFDIIITEQASNKEYKLPLDSINDPVKENERIITIPPKDFDGNDWQGKTYIIRLRIGENIIKNDDQMKLVINA